MNQPPPGAHAWIEVNLQALRHNYREVCRLVAPSQIIPVVKANAYGHGIQEVARALEAEGAGLLAVTHVPEAGALREAGVGCGILVMAPPRGGDVARAVELDASICVMDPEGAEEASRAAEAAGRDVSVHMKLDTGMSRLGVRTDGALDLARQITASPRLNLAGVFSHCAEGHREPAVRRQMAIYTSTIQTLQKAGIDTGIRHLAASAASLSTPEARLDAVRIGTLLYGQFSTRSLQRSFASTLDLQEPWSFRSRIIAVRKVMPGASIGYGAEYQTSRPSRIAVVPVGTADGLGVQPLSLSRRGLAGAARALLPKRFALWAKVRGEAVPLVGRVAMQMCALDVTDLEDVQVGEVVELPVRRILANLVTPRVFVG